MFYLLADETSNFDSYYCKRNIDVFCIPHIHSKLELVFVLDGYLNLTSDKKVIELKKNDMAIIMPYEIHGFETDKNSDMLVMNFPTSYIAEYIQIFKGKEFENPVAVMDGVIRNFANDFIRDETPDILKRKAFIYYTMSVFLKSCQLKDATNYSNDTLRLAIDYIYEHFKDGITLKKTAESVGVTESHLSRLLNQRAGFSFARILNSRRVCEAKSLLLQTEKSISEIAYESGFGSIRNFNRIFEDFFGCSPSDVKSKRVNINFLSTRDGVEE